MALKLQLFDFLSLLTLSRIWHKSFFLSWYFFISPISKPGIYLWICRWRTKVGSDESYCKYKKNNFNIGFSRQQPFKLINIVAIVLFSFINYRKHILY